MNEMKLNFFIFWKIFMQILYFWKKWKNQFWINLNNLYFQAADEEEMKSESNEIFKQFPKKACLIGQPLLTTLYYCCLYHYNLPVNNYASPLAFKQAFHIADKPFFWMAASANCRRKQFNEVEKLMVSKKMIVTQKLLCPFSWPTFFGLVAKYQPIPVEVWGEGSIKGHEWAMRKDMILRKPLTLKYYYIPDFKQMAESCSWCFWTFKSCWNVWRHFGWHSNWSYLCH